MRVIALTLLLFGLLGSPTYAQSLGDEKKAVLVFDIRMDMLNSSELGKKMKFAENLSQMNAQSGEESPDPAKLDRIFGAMSAPKNMEEMMAIQNGGELPFEFFARAKYKDAETAKSALDLSLNGQEEKIERNGRTLYKTGEGGDVPPGLYMHMIDELTVEVGTEAYVFHEDRNVFTDALKASWGKAPNEAIRMAMDLEGAKGLVAELIKEGKANAPSPMIGPFLDLVSNIKDMGISIDLSSKNLLTLRANTMDSEGATAKENAEELKGGLDSLLFLAKTGAQQGVQMMESQGDEGKSIAKVLSKMLSSMKAKQSGTDVRVEIVRPNGFEEAVQSAAEIIPAMMFGGGGGGGGLAPPPLRPPGDRR